MARKRSGDATPPPKRDRRQEQKDRRAAAAADRSGRRSGDTGWRGDKRSPEGRRAEDDAKAQRGYSRSEDPDLQSPPGGTQREVWVKDPEPEPEEEK
jgi:hypothetical protein